MSSGDQPRFYHLRPVEGKGLKPIVLREAETVVVGRGERLGISSAKIGAKHLECRLTLSPVVAVELRASEVVYVKDRFGVLKMLKANFIGYLKMGEVLYLCANKQPQFGYILTEGMPKTRKGSAGRGDEEPAPADAPRAEAKGEECIDLLNDPSDDECEVPGSAARKQSAKRKADGKTQTEWRPKQPDAETDEGKGTAEDPCELLSSDDEVVVSEPEQKSKARTTKKGGRGAGKTAAGRGQGGRGKEKVKGKSKEAERDPPKPQREEPKQHGGFQDGAHQAGGAGPSNAGFTNHTQVPHLPPEPAPSHSDDTPVGFDTQSEFDDDVEGIQGSPHT